MYKILFAFLAILAVIVFSSAKHVVDSAKNVQQQHNANIAQALKDAGV